MVDVGDVGEFRPPTYVMVPKGYTIDHAAQAITLCRQLGVLKENPAGWLLIPEEATRLFRGPFRMETDHA